MEQQGKRNSIRIHIDKKLIETDSQEEESSDIEPKKEIKQNVEEFVRNDSQPSLTISDSCPKRIHSNFCKRPSEADSLDTGRRGKLCKGCPRKHRLSNIPLLFAFSPIILSPCQPSISLLQFCRQRHPEDTIVECIKLKSELHSINIGATILSNNALKKVCRL